MASIERYPMAQPLLKQPGLSSSESNFDLSEQQRTVTSVSNKIQPDSSNALSSVELTPLGPRAIKEPLSVRNIVRLTINLNHEEDPFLAEQDNYVPKLVKLSITLNEENEDAVVDNSQDGKQQDPSIASVPSSSSSTTLIATTSAVKSVVLDIRSRADAFMDERDRYYAANGSPSTYQQMKDLLRRYELMVEDGNGNFIDLSYIPFLEHNFREIFNRKNEENKYRHVSLSESIESNSEMNDIYMRLGDLKNKLFPAKQTTFPKNLQVSSRKPREERQTCCPSRKLRHSVIQDNGCSIRQRNLLILASVVVFAVIGFFLLIKYYEDGKLN